MHSNDKVDGKLMIIPESVPVSVENLFEFYFLLYYKFNAFQNQI